MKYLVDESRLTANQAFAKYPLVPDKTALIIVDMQYGFLEPGEIFASPYPGWDTLISVHRKLVGFFRERSIPIIWVAFSTTGKTKSNLWLLMPEVYGPPGNYFQPGKHSSDLIREISPRAEEPLIWKHCFDGFYDTDLDTVLRSLDIEFTLFTGVATNYCVGNTLRSAFHRLYKVVLISDACGTHNQKLHEAECTIIAMRYGRIMTSDEVIVELSRADISVS